MKNHDFNCQFEKAIQMLFRCVTKTNYFLTLFRLKFLILTDVRLKYSIGYILINVINTSMPIAEVLLMPYL